jgi:DNA polymerase II large subunit
MNKYDLACSEKVEKYFDYLSENTQEAYERATAARALSYDPEDVVEIRLAKNMAERVVGIISIAAPQIVGSGVTERIIELEKKYASQDWRVAFEIALEIAKQQYCKFDTDLEAIEVGIRTGFAYVTVGVVSSPLEGFTSIDIKKRRDGKGEFFRINFAGPIRNAGGTGASVSVLIADYVRKHLGYAKYDPDEKEIQRCYAELEDYHRFIANLQYFPYKEESEFLLKNIPVEIAGDPSEKRELSNAGLKDLPRIETNYLRSGYCLIHSSCIPLKSAKLWKKLSKWGHDMGMEDWDFIGEHLKLQKELKAKKSAETDSKKKDESSEQVKVKPDPTFVTDIVGGRPVLGHPMSSGGFRLRYGRSRTSGYSGQSVHPATMQVLENFVATGTQLKVERPGKAATYTPCDSIMGPTVRLKNGDVLYLDTEEQSLAVTENIEEILYLGDTLINYGDFFDRAHPLITPGYCEEWWYEELLEALTKENKKLQDCDILTDEQKKQLPVYKQTLITFEQAVRISETYQIPLHPHYIFFFKEVEREQLLDLLDDLEQTDLNIPLQLSKYSQGTKRCLELLGVPHKVSESQKLTFKEHTIKALLYNLRIRTKEDIQSMRIAIESHDVYTALNQDQDILIKDKSGYFIGARMGRPEKAKMRKMTGSPHGLFPIGEEGGRLRSFQAALEYGKVTADLPIYKCLNCENQTSLRRCELCDTKTEQQFIEPKSGNIIDPKTNKEDLPLIDHKRQEFRIRPIFDACLKMMDTRIYPDLIKGVRGVMGKERTPEHPIKAILRAKHDVAVNKDGTVRYDASELCLTHFKPHEVGTPVKRLIELGYTHDVYGEPLVHDDQILELFCQDVVLPACPQSPDEGCDSILLRTTKFIDDTLQYLYKQQPFFNAQEPIDLVGHLVVGLAPHTSAGTVGRIIGFSKTQGLLAHPFYHASFRRDCDGDEAAVFLLFDAFLNFSRKFLPTTRGSTMDAPLVLTTVLNPSEVDDMAFNVDRVGHYPLEFYRACEEYKYPWDVNIQLIDNVLFTPEQFEGLMFTHHTSSFNSGVLCSDYKLLPSMAEKITGQMSLAQKIRAVRSSDVAALVIEKHFIRDLKGNLRKFSMQQFRCVKCNGKYRRTPLTGKCTVCGGKIIFTISQGSIEKYLKASLTLAEDFHVSDYLKETIYLTEKRIVDVFGKEKEKQTGLSAFME